MGILWVKLAGKNSLTEVSTDNCRNVDGFIDVCKAKFLLRYGEFPNGEPFLSTTKNGLHFAQAFLWLKSLNGPDMMKIATDGIFIQEGFNFKNENPTFIAWFRTLIVWKQDQEAIIGGILSARSSTTSIISCKSMSVSGRCSTSRHTDRNKRCQQKFSSEKKLLRGTLKIQSTIPTLNLANEQNTTPQTTRRNQNYPRMPPEPTRPLMLEGHFAL
jgi:hypothetical protein